MPTTTARRPESISLPDAIGVLDRAKPVDAFQIGAWDRDAPVPPTSGDEQHVEWHAAMIFELHEPCAVSMREAAAPNIVSMPCSA